MRLSAFHYSFSYPVFSILSILIFTLYSALLKPLNDLSHFLIKDSIIIIIIIIIIIVIIIIIIIL